MQSKITYEDVRKLSNSGNLKSQNFRTSSEVVQPEPMPTKSDKKPAMWDLVTQDILNDAAARDNFGREKYNTRLQPFNGRNALKDAYQESLDQTVYLRQAMYEDMFNQRVIDAAMEMFDAEQEGNRTAAGMQQLKIQLYLRVKELKEIMGD